MKTCQKLNIFLCEIEFLVSGQPSAYICGEHLILLNPSCRESWSRELRVCKIWTEESPWLSGAILYTLYLEWFGESKHTQAGNQDSALGAVISTFSTDTSWNDGNNPKLFLCGFQYFWNLVRIYTNIFACSMKHFGICAAQGELTEPRSCMVLPVLWLSNLIDVLQAVSWPCNSHILIFLPLYNWFTMCMWFKCLLPFYSILFPRLSIKLGACGGFSLLSYSYFSSPA